MILTTLDSDKISVNHFKKGKEEAIILAHGFFNNKDVYLFRKISEMLHRHYDVISFDFRGHGKSNGLFSWTHHESADLRAVISYAVEEGYKKIGVIGFSLGAAVTLIEASRNRNIASIIAVSSPYDFWKIDFRFWEREMLNDLRIDFGPRGWGKGVRPGNPFLPKVKPIDIISEIAPTPILFLHGEEDWLIKPRHSEKLFDRARTPKELVVLPKAGHAETMFEKYETECERICTEWFGKTLGNAGGIL